MPEPGYGRSVGAVVGGLILVLFGLFMALAGGALFAVGTSVDLDELLRQVEADLEVTNEFRDYWSAFTGASLFFAVAGVLQLLAGILVFAHKSLGRILGILFGLAGAALFGLAAFGTWQYGRFTAVDGAEIDITSNAAIAGGIALAYLFVFLVLAAGGRHFRRGRAE
jgi:hypothetical protein